MIRRYLIIFVLMVSGTLLFKAHPAFAFNGNNVIDDGVFDRANSMSAVQIDNWLNANFPSSCISSNNGFTAPDPTGYSPNPSQFLYSSTPVTAGQIVYDTSQAYSINPQVLLATLEKEENLVTGTSGCASWRYASAVGYGCTDSGTNTHDYGYPSGGLVTPLYYINGNPVNSITGSCVNSGPKAGFSEQIIHAAWLLTFSRHKAEGDTGWAVIKGSWNNCDDNNTCPSAWNIPASDACYSGFMTQGNFKRCPTDSTTVFYDGYTTIDGGSVHIDNGATAAFYVYTPHFSGNSSFDNLFQSWFGSYYDKFTWSPNSQYAYTDQAKTTPVDLNNLVVGQKVYVGFKALNTGDTTWSNSGNNPVDVGTTSSQDRNSLFCDTTDTPSWLGCGRPAGMKEPSVAPGQTATFEFWYQAPMQANTYNEHFSLVAEGLKWMNDPGMYFHAVVKPPIYTWSLQSQYAYTDQTKSTAVSLSNLAPSQKTFVGFTAKNTGNVTWSNSGANPVHVGTSSPLDRTSVFCDKSDTPSWLGCGRPAGMKEASVAPGQTATFEFWYQAPATVGIYQEHFTPVAEGIAWMNDVGLNYYTMVHFDTSGGFSLGANQLLNMGQSITSADGRYRLYMQNDGNLVLYSIKRALWSSGTSNKPVTSAVMQSDGNLVLYDSQAKAYWSSGTAGKGSSSLVVQNDGNLVIYNSNNAIWNTLTSGQF